jgi:hypothetical protein
MVKNCRLSGVIGLQGWGGGDGHPTMVLSTTNKPSIFMLWFWGYVKNKVFSSLY